MLYSCVEASLKSQSSYLQRDNSFLDDKTNFNYDKLQDGIVQDDHDIDYLIKKLSLTQSHRNKRSALLSSGKLF